MSCSVAPSLRSELLRCLESLQLLLSAQQQNALMGYLDVLQQWNRVYNLTALRNPREMLSHHVFDSLSAVPALQRHIEQSGARTLLDLGSGGGLPGAIFAICLPDLQVTCVDAVGKKAAFIRHAAAKLSLNNLQGVHSRVEQLRGGFDVVSSRAFASLPEMVRLSQQLLGERGVWLAMKGKRPDDEMAALPASVQVFHVEPLQVPLLDAERCLVWMRLRDNRASLASHR